MQKKFTYDDIEEPGISPEEKSQRSWQFYLGKDSSIITDLFLGQFRSTLKCTECEHESVTFEPFWLVSVPLAKDSVDLHQCMELFVKAETLGDDEMPTCEECKERRKCVKWYTSEYLFIRYFHSQLRPSEGYLSMKKNIFFSFEIEKKIFLKQNYFLFPNFCHSSQF